MGSLRQRSKVFTAVKIHVEVFWVVTPCGGVVGHQHFRGLCYLHFRGEVTSSLRRPRFESLRFRLTNFAQYEFTRTLAGSCHWLV
jgi:hypothetical protein